MSVTRIFLLGLSLFAAETSAVTCSYFGNGVSSCRLEVVHDVSLERETTNYNYLEYLLIGEHPQYPLKRSLLRFEDLLPGDTRLCQNVEQAWMYVYFAYAHKPSWHSADFTPYVQHKAQVHMVNKPWVETEATSKYQDFPTNSLQWNSPYLALDGTDAEAGVLASELMNINQPSRFVEFEVTDAVSQWFTGRVENNGLLMKVEDEGMLGRDLRFYSNAHSDPEKHAFINVICT